ncbi:hypothetical protein AVO45_14785 [Ruegeria marisrubri]|uniref:FAD-binding FR-type domain-containing protein n=1 Tax=Ruegeria marisrubri TaxID=1685379 RepID=A0A0X3TC44_9RHOB|nr:ferredoxin reductase family protein [Ruegeria marisrubri]KUJ73348.1 hypothetical protein AVO45_14785 [Ruegeria marisrubri]
MPGWLLFLVYLGALLAPVALAVLQGIPPRSLWDELATGAGLLATAILLVEFPLSGRFRVISRRIGMDVTMRWHQLLGRVALVLALIHPFLYRAERNPAYPWDTTRQLTLSWQPETILPGAMAWFLLPVLVGLALSRSAPGKRYEKWRLGHGLTALAVAGFAIWHALAAGRYSADPALAALWLGLGGIAVLSLLRVYLFAPLARLRRPWRVTRIGRVAERTWEMVLTPEGHDGLRYEAGQFAWLQVGRSPFSVNDNPFSIASAPSEGPEIRFVIKELGDFTRSLGTIAAGTRAYLDAPFGHLTLSGQTAPGIALIAGGVGIAPMLGLLRELRAQGDPRPVTLLYGNRAASQIVDGEELAAMEQAGRLRLVHVLSEPPEGWQGEVGMVDRRILEKVFDDSAQKDWVFVLCGPPAMLDSVRRDLVAMGVPPRQILSEAFVYS